MFQALKVLYGADKYFETVEGNDEFRLSEEGKRLFLEILNANPFDAPKSGRKVEGLHRETWDQDKKFLMK